MHKRTAILLLLCACAPAPDTQAPQLLPQTQIIAASSALKGSTSPEAALRARAAALHARAEALRARSGIEPELRARIAIGIDRSRVEVVDVSR